MQRGTVGAMERSWVAPVESVTDRVVHVAAFVPVAPARAFAYFTSPDLLTTWLTTVAEVEAVVGGRYELFWNPRDREVDSTIGCRTTAPVADELVAFQWRGPRPFRDSANGADPLTDVVVAFVPVGAGTRVHLVHSGWRSGPEWEAARAWQERAWSGALRELERVAVP